MLGFAAIGELALGEVPGDVSTSPQEPPPVGNIDATKVPTARVVVFAGGIRTVVFTGGIRTVRF